MPRDDRRTVSRRIRDEAERERLRPIVEGLPVRLPQSNFLQEKFGVFWYVINNLLVV